MDWTNKHATLQWRNVCITVNRFKKTSTYHPVIAMLDAASDADGYGRVRGVGFVVRDGMGCIHYNIEYAFNPLAMGQEHRVHTYHLVSYRGVHKRWAKPAVNWLKIVRA